MKTLTVSSKSNFDRKILGIVLAFEVLLFWNFYCREIAWYPVIIIIGAPILILNWPAIHNSYVVGHVVGDEKYIRAAELGIKGTVGHLLFYIGFGGKGHQVRDAFHPDDLADLVLKLIHSSGSDRP